MHRTSEHTFGFACDCGLHTGGVHLRKGMMRRDSTSTEIGCTWEKANCIIYTYLSILELQKEKKGRVYDKLPLEQMEKFVPLFGIINL